MNHIFMVLSKYSFIVSLFRVLHHGHGQSELLDLAKSSRGTYLHKVVQPSFFH